MPRFTAPAPNSESRRALEQRAREATKPAAPQGRGRWPFPVMDSSSPQARQDADHGDAGGKPGDQDA
ncbi:MAG: hypothetical protein JWQ72_690 [Polaromonas sp.]|nr:hypothetical protein [Polaromonas sp.]